VVKFNRLFISGIYHFAELTHYYCFVMSEIVGKSRVSVGAVSNRA